MTPGLMILKLSEGMTTSFFIFSLTLVFSLPLGLGVALKKEARGLFGGSALGTDPRKEEI